VVAANTTTPARVATPSSNRVNFFIVVPSAESAVVEPLYFIQPIRSGSDEEYTTGERANLLDEGIDRYLSIGRYWVAVSTDTKVA
jgi:hypothetical protein